LFITESLERSNVTFVYANINKQDQLNENTRDCANELSCFYPRHIFPSALNEGRLSEKLNLSLSDIIIDRISGSDFAGRAGGQTKAEMLTVKMGATIVCGTS
jgi:hypothetical protein